MITTLNGTDTIKTLANGQYRVTIDDVARTILPGEPCSLIGGLIPKR